MFLGLVLAGSFDVLVFQFCFGYFGLLFRLLIGLTMGLWFVLVAYVIVWMRFCCVVCVVWFSFAVLFFCLVLVDLYGLVSAFEVVGGFRCFWFVCWFAFLVLCLLGGFWRGCFWVCLVFCLLSGGFDVDVVVREFAACIVYALFCVLCGFALVWCFVVLLVFVSLWKLVFRE